MTTIQLFFAIVCVVSAELAVVLAFMFNGFSEVKQQINSLIQYIASHEGKIATLEERTKQK
jgi:membrane protein implicated in regulation of membrane protease activity